MNWTGDLGSLVRPDSLIFYTPQTVSAVGVGTLRPAGNSFASMALTVITAIEPHPIRASDRYQSLEIAVVHDRHSEQSFNVRSSSAVIPFTCITHALNRSLAS